MGLRSLALIVAALASPAGASEFRLSWPVDCTLGESCHIQQYVDQDSGPGARDFTCGGLSYDGHKGTDIALPSLAALQTGVAVLAAADGVVAGIRDGMQDAYATPERADEIAGKDCGNGVVLRHPDGWETQYCHMKLGSVAVEPGQTIAAGTPLGDLGLSGRTQFPHLHLSVRHNGEVVDPFAPDPARVGTCGAPQSWSLWQTPPPYGAGGVISVGLYDKIPDYDTVKAGTADITPFPTTASAVVLWGYGFGSKAGDTMVLRLTDPQHNIVFETEQTLERAQAQFFRAAGKRLRAPLPPGPYIGEVELWRNKMQIDVRSQSFELRPPLLTLQCYHRLARCLAKRRVRNKIIRANIMTTCPIRSPQK